MQRNKGNSISTQKNKKDQCKMVWSPLTIVQWFLKKVNTELAYDPAIRPLNTDLPGNSRTVAEVPRRRVKQEDRGLSCGPRGTSRDHRGSTALLDMPPGVGRKCSSLPPAPTFETHHLLPLAKWEDSGQRSLGNSLQGRAEHKCESRGK